MKLDELPFDHVRSEGEDWTVDEFLALPRSQRTRHMAGGQLEFTKQGYVVDREEALIALRAYAAVLD